jgi:hypothetical protein
MRKPNHQTTQVFTLFGEVYVPKSHEQRPSFEDGHKRSRRGGWMMVLIAALLAATTAATAIAAKGRIHAPTPELWRQSPPTFSTRSLGMIGFEDALY